MIVVFDTNVWISDLALTSNVGSAIRFFLREQGARIGLPEVVKMETEFHLRSTLSSHIRDIESSHRQLLAVFGRLKEVVLPTEEEVERLISQVFSNIGVEIEQLPFTLESARASLIRAVKKVPPSDKNQQFKDGVLWEDCCRLLDSEPVLLVTNDTAFYRGRNTGHGLAKELELEIESLANKLRIFPSLRDLLNEIGTDVQIDSKVLVDAYISAHRDKLEALTDDSGFEREGQPVVDVDVFVTEKPNSLFMTFTIVFPCVDVSGDERTEARILARGEGSYDAEAKRITEIANRGEQLLYYLRDGTEKKKESHVLVAGSLVLGHRTVEHSIRYKL